MMKRGGVSIFLLAFTLVGSALLQAEEAYEMEWIKQFGTPGATSGYSIAADTSGNIVTSGYTAGSLGGENNGGTDTYVAKYDSAGTRLWISQFGTPGSDFGFSVAVESSGNIFVTGRTHDRFEGQNSSGGIDAYVTKLSSDGTLEWTRQFGTPGTDAGWSVAVDGSGNVFVGGYTTGTFDGESSSGAEDAFLAKFSGDGTLLWVEQFGTSGLEYGLAGAVDTSGNAFIGGYTTGTFTGESSSGASDAYIAKFNSDGTLLWIEQFGTSSSEDGYDIAIDNSYNIVVTGKTSGRFEGESGVGGYDAYVAKFSGDGILTWLTQFGTTSGEGGYSVTVDSGGNIFAAGKTSGTFDGESSSGDDDIYIAKFSSDGTLKWTRQFGTPERDYGFSVAADGSGSAYLTGYTWGIFDGQSSSGGYMETFIAKFANPNTAPNANAGNDFSAPIGTTATLNGGGSSDPDETYPLTYAWEFVSKPNFSEAVLAAADTVSPTFTPDYPGDYVIELIVTDAGGAVSEADTVTVNTYNSTPSADAGEDQAIDIVGTMVTLDGSGSYDENGDDLTYHWKITQKPAYSSAVLDDPASLTPQFTTDINGMYTVELNVTDNWGAYDIDEVIVSFNNVVPVADAGDNQSAVVGDVVTLDGSGSTDANGDPITYSWSLSAKPEGSLSTVSNPANMVSSFIPDLEGTYYASLVVNDGIVDSNPDNAGIVVITVSTATTQSVSETIETINTMPEASFDNPNFDNALTNKLNAILSMIADEQYEQALSKLQNDILPKTDGCILNGEPDKRDWINTCEEQEVVYRYVQDTIARLQTLIAEQ